MSHPEDGRLQALLDRELTGSEEEELRKHLDGCSACTAELEALSHAGEVTARALELLDVAPDLASARQRFQERRASVSVRPLHPTPSHRWWGRIPLTRAASIALLLTAGAVTALPGSPVRRWLGQGWDALVGHQEVDTAAESTAAEESPTPAAAPVSRETGAFVRAGEEGVELWIQELPAGAQVRIRWVEEGDPGIFAGEGTRYLRQDNRLEAQAPPGSVRVEIPRSLTRAVVGVNGTVVLRLTPQGMELTRPVESSSDTEILFSPFGGGDDGGAGESVGAGDSGRGDEGPVYQEP